jgi:leucyl/phenylalanyl-tRNA--protein transferase
MPRRVAQRLPRLSDSPGPFDGRRLVAGEDLVAVGGEPDVDLVWHAYRHGVFPWYAAGEPPLWWCPDPRGVLPTSGQHVPRRLERSLATGRWTLTRGRAFTDVVDACADARPGGTWIHPALRATYLALAADGRACSFEAWHEGRLVGGLFGLRLGRVFCAESKFHRARDASKAVLVHAVRSLAAEGVEVLELQFVTPHLAQFGAREIPRSDYLRLLT